MFVLKFVVAVVLVEAVVQIATEAEIFEGLRAWFDGADEEPSKMGVFARCGYCQSVWAGWAVAFVLSMDGMFPWLTWGEPLVWGLVVHRASNIWHEVVSRHQNRVPLTLFMRTWRHEDPPPRKEGPGDGAPDGQ
jgi:hypothetical protein